MRHRHGVNGVVHVIGGVDGRTGRTSSSNTISDSTHYNITFSPCFSFDLGADLKYGVFVQRL
jgi:hypothetical protein